MILQIIVSTIFIATIFNIILNKFNMPTIIGYIITGTIISHVFGLGSTDELKSIAEFGIVFLMFTIGLELSLKDLLKMKKNVFLFGSMQFLITSIVFYLLSILLFGLSSREAIIISLGLSLSSTAIVLKILNENGDINKSFGNRSLGILIFQDLMVIPIMFLITVYSTVNTDISALLLKTFASGLTLLFTLWLISRFLLDNFLYKVAKTKSNEIFIGSILFIVIGSSLLAHSLGFTYSLGAFLAGMIIAKTHYKHQVEADLIPFRDLLLGFFFLTVGMQLDFEIVYKNIGFIIILLTGLIIIKISILHSILVWFAHKRSAFKTALSLFQFGEFGIVVFELATIKNLIDPNLGNILIVVIILSMFITPVILKNLSEITDYLFGYKYLDTNGEFLSKNLKNHVILIGYGRLGKILGEFLEKNKIDYVIIENNINTYKEAKKDLKPIIFGNAFQANTLKAVNIEEADTVLISIGNSEKLFLVADVVKKLNIKGNIVVKVNNFNEEIMLNDLDIKTVIVETEKTALAMFEKVRVGEVI